MTCILEQEDYELLESLIRISESIEKIYHTLFKLEINDKKNSSEYKKYLDYLTIAKDVEKRMYQENDMNALKCAEFLNYLVNSQNLNQTDETMLINRNFKDAKQRRVYNLLNKYMYEDFEGMRKLCVEEIHFDGEKMIVNDMVNLNYIKELLTLQIQKESNMMFLSFIFESINKDEFKNVKSDMIKMKYYLSFLNPNIEEDMLYDNFEVSKNVSIFSNVYAYCSDMKQSDYLIIQNRFGRTKALEQISALLEFNDLHYLDKENSFKAYLHSCMLRSYLSFLSDISILNIHSSFEKQLINKAKDKIKHYISEKIIKDSFYSLYTDRNKQIILKLVK